MMKSDYQRSYAATIVLQSEAVLCQSPDAGGHEGVGYEYWSGFEPDGFDTNN